LGWDNDARLLRDGTFEPSHSSLTLPSPMACCAIYAWALRYKEKNASLASEKKRQATKSIPR